MTFTTVNPKPMIELTDKHGNRVLVSVADIAYVGEQSEKAVITMNSGSRVYLSDTYDYVTAKMEQAYRLVTGSG